MINCSLRVDRLSAKRLHVSSSLVLSGNVRHLVGKTTGFARVRVFALNRLHCLIPGNTPPTALVLTAQKTSFSASWIERGAPSAYTALRNPLPAAPPPVFPLAASIEVDWP